MIPENKKDTILKIEEVLEQLRPYLKADGGNISFVELTDENIVKVQLLGACQSCNMSIMTLKAGVEDSIKRAIPQIKAVEAVSADVTENIF